MPISVEQTTTSASDVAAVFATVRLLRCWDDVAGVRVQGVDDRAIDVGDTLDIAVDVVGRTVGITAVVDSIVAPGDAGDGSASVLLRTVAGAVDGTITGAICPAGAGSELRLRIDGRGRGAIRLLEVPLEAIARRWVAHQLAHLAREAASR